LQNEDLKNEAEKYLKRRVLIEKHNGLVFLLPGD
jgi:hypothetical protein